MEFKEIYTIAFEDEVYTPGCFQRNEGYCYAITYRREINIIKWLCDWNLISKNKLRTTQSKIQIVEFYPYDLLLVDDAQIFNNANIHEKNAIVMDPCLSPNHLLHTSEANSFIDVKWSPLGNALSSDQLIAVTTYAGACFVYKIDHGGSEWKIVKRLQSTPCNVRCTTLAILQKSLNEICFSSISWNNVVFKSQRYFCATTKCGQVYCYKFELNGESEYEFDQNLNVTNIVSLHWASFSIESTNGKSFLLYANQNGQIYMKQMSFISGNPILIADSDILIWKEEDKLKPLMFIVHYYASHDSTLITTFKGCSVLVMHIDLQTKVVTSTIRRLKGIISCCDKIKKSEYLVGTSCGKVYVIRVQITKGSPANIQIMDSEVTINISNYSKYTLLGMAFSPNKIFCTFLLSLKCDVYDENIHKKNTKIVFTLNNLINPLHMLLDNPDRKLRNYYDCVEALRLCNEMNTEIEFSNYLKTEEETLTGVDSFLYFIQLKMVFIRNQIYNQYSVKHDNNLREIANLMELKQFVHSIDRLRLLADHVTSSTEPLKQCQMLSGKCLLNFVDSFIEKHFDKDGIKVNEAIMLLLAEHTNSGPILQYLKSTEEYCIFCKRPIKPDTMKCEQNHNVPRCCITLMQLPITASRNCEQCGSSALNDIEIDFPFFLSSQKLECPICDGDLETKSFDNLFL